MKRYLPAALVLLLLFATACTQKDPEGELWLFSGQSNMELPISRCMDVVAEDVVEYFNEDLNYIKVPLSYNFNGPQKTLPPGSLWEKLDSPHSAQHWGALCYFAARYLNEATGKKICIINSSVGGSPIEAWLPEERLLEKALAALAECRDPKWMQKTLNDNARVDQDWQALIDAAAEDGGDWEAVDIFGDWGKKDGETVYGRHLLRNTFELSEQQCKGDAILHLGAMCDSDSSFVNGHYVGNITYRYPPRNYRVPAEYLQEGENEVEVRLYSAENTASFIPDKQYSLETTDGKVSLLEGWQHRLSRRVTGRAPYEFLHYRPSGLYNSMIAPLKGRNFKGVVWYQGESNTERAEEYEELLKTMISSWRELFDNPRLPFYIVELAAFEHSELETSLTSGWVRLQDVQRKVAEEMENVYLVPNRDLGEWNDIHPQDKKTLGRRLVDCIITNIPEGSSAAVTLPGSSETREYPSGSHSLKF